jgi:hypothetical protein
MLFHKKMSVLDMDNFFHNKKIGFLVVETFDLKCYGFIYIKDLTDVCTFVRLLYVCCVCTVNMGS